MEGLFGRMQSNLHKKSRQLKIKLEQKRALVPAHPDLSEGLTKYVDRSIKETYDNFLQKQYRDAVAHFELNSQSPINVGSGLDRLRFANVAFLADICSRVLIQRHEAALRLLATLAPGEV